MKEPRQFGRNDRHRFILQAPDVVAAFEAGRSAFLRGDKIGHCFYAHPDKVEAFERGFRWEKNKSK